MEKTTTSLQTVEKRPVSASILDLPPDQMIENARNIANTLADVIEKQNLYTRIQGKKHITCDGWATLGTMLGILPREEKVIELEDGSYEASVQLVAVGTGRVIGGASAICAMDEKQWSASPKYARRSMAVTRATGKAYRLTFAWIPSLAGYATTPAEEMDPKEDKTQIPIEAIYERVLKKTANISDEETRIKVRSNIEAKHDNAEYLLAVEARINELYK